MAPIARPKAQKPSKVVKPKKSLKHSTASHKNHRFQPFSERIAKLKIDPIRRRRNAEDGQDLSGEADTYFGKALEEWRDLNLSQTFTSFAKEAAPLCESLPALLHSEGKMMDLLVLYIEKGDSLAMEPLLSLLSSFAHDLDARFEKHFQRAVSTVASVAAKHSDPAVVEWSFTCLAWLFKYLSRLLVPDLRPLYDLMAPYLGREPQKPFIVRFAAESLSFLIRKAAASYERDPASLQTIVTHMLQDCENAPDLQRQGIMTLLTETMRGVQSGLHSGGLQVLQCLLRTVSEDQGSGGYARMEILTGVVTNTIHHTTAETFAPVQDAILAHARANLKSGQTSQLDFNARLIFTIASVRKGTRISDWKSLVSTLRDMSELASKHNTVGNATRSSIMSAVAVTLQSASIDAVLPNLSMMETLRRELWAPLFLEFCDLFARLGKDRFQQFLLPQLQKYVMEHYSDNGDAILSTLPTLAAQPKKCCISCPEPFQQRIVQQVEALAEVIASAEQRGENLITASRNLKALSYVKLGDAARRRLLSGLESIVRSALDGVVADTAMPQSVALGPCFDALLDLLEDQDQISDLWPSLCDSSPKLMGLPAFWKNLHRYLKASSKFTDGAHTEVLESTLLDCLSAPSHVIRQAALDIIEVIHKLRGHASPAVLLTAITIEATPINFETSRRISMDIRRLAQGYSSSGVDPFMQRAIPSYCFGLLHVQLTQAWDDAIDVLAEISKTQVGKESITTLAQTWLDGAIPKADEDIVNEYSTVLDVDSNGFQVASDFECSNLARMSAVCEQVFNAENRGRPTTMQELEIDYKHVPLVPETARGQALRVLNKIPHVGEKRSRMLVPILLRWAGTSAMESEAGSSQRWNRADQKAMLSVFAQFTNPKVLFKQAEVYSALLNLCSNGDVDIQRSALKAICAWKESAVVRYEEHLTNLLDESRFREELSVFLQDSSDDGEVAARPDDYPKLMPVLLRLIYGRAIAGGKHGQGTRRKAIFVALSQHGEDVLKTFIDIALGPLADLGAVSRSNLESRLSALSNIPLRRQLGMTNMFDDMLEALGSELEPFGTKIMAAALLPTVSACRRLNSAEDAEDASLLRSIRQAGIQCLTRIFKDIPGSSLIEYVQLALEEIVAPRLEKLASENTQSVSGLLKLISSWSLSSHLVRCVVQKPSLLGRIADLLREPTAKDEVRVFILSDILDKVLEHGVDGLLEPDHIRNFTISIGIVLNQQPAKPVLDACVASLTKLAGLIGSKSEAEGVLAVCADLLTKPGMIVSPATKIGLLRTVMPLVENFEISADAALYNAICGLFSRLHGQEHRELLSSVLVKLCSRDKHLLSSAEICADMNATGDGLSEVDHARRERGFAKVSELAPALSTSQWQPIVHNCLFYIRDADDMVNRSSASQALQKFVSSSSLQESSKALLADTLLPGIERGMREESELVRAEYLHLLGNVVEGFPEWQAVKDMSPLSVGGDDEASVFSNILHIQQHRRLRALRRLAEEATALSSSNTTRFFLPLLEHFVFDQAEGDAGRTLSDQTIQTLGALAKSLTWPAYRATFKRYIGYLSSKEDHEKAVLRLLGTFVDALSPAAASAEKDAKKSEIIMRDFLPPLTDYVHHKDESTIDRRMPVAITIVKLLQCLSETEMVSRLAPVLSDVCHVLRSRSQEARDQTRKTLASISSLVGSAYLGYILKELRSALQRGYQLHVLSFTVHSLLINAVETCDPGDLDYCLPDLVTVIMDDIFGVTGQEKDAEEYKSGMKEVKSSKSFDTMELLARVTPVQKLGLLVKPVRDLLSEKLDSKMLKKIDDLLTRLRKGLDQNPAADTRDMLIFCHEIVRQVHAEQQASANPTKKDGDRRVNRYLIQMESANKSKTKGTTTSQLFKLASFALNLVRKVLRRHEDLMTAANMAGFLPIAGDALVQGQEDVQVAAVKLLSTIMKLHMTALDNNAATYVNESVRLIKGANSMTTDSAKAALELITSVLREKRSVSIKDRDIGEVLKCLKQDIDEPDRQGIIYKFLRAVLGRKIMIKEVYELMDEVGKVVVTNPDRNVRESARSAYFQFVMEYPQGRDRWNKQAAFFVENLKYERPNGRQSVMELLNQLLAKVGDDVFGQLAFTLFVALVPVLANDEDGSCRQMAGLLIGKIVERADEEQMETFMNLVDKWLANLGNQTIMIAALRCWMAILRTRTPERQRIEGLRDRLEFLIAEGSSDMKKHDTEDPKTMAALQTAEVLMETQPEVAFAPNEDDADICKPLATFVMLQHLEAKELAAKLLTAFMSHIASSAAKTGGGLADLPLRGAQGIEVGKDDLRHMCWCTLAALRKNTDQLNESIINYNIRNLVFLGRCFAANEMSWKDATASDSDSEEEKDLEAEANPHNDPSALAYLLNRLAYITRQETFPPISRTAAIRAQTALLPHLPTQIPNLQTLIHPLYLLTDPSIPQPPGDAHRTLTDHARELLDAVQKKVGSEVFVAALGQARRAVGERREERKRKRRVERVSAPERWAREKKRKVEGKREKKRERGLVERGRGRGW